MHAIKRMDRSCDFGKTFCRQLQNMGPSDITGAEATQNLVGLGPKRGLQIWRTQTARKISWCRKHVREKFRSQASHSEKKKKG